MPLKIFIIVIISIVFSISSMETATAVLDDFKVPFWFKKTAKWWAEGQISDVEFRDTAEFLLKKNVISSSNFIITSENNQRSNTEIPDRFKEHTYLWATQKIGDRDFGRLMQKMIRDGHIGTGFLSVPSPIQFSMHGNPANVDLAVNHVEVTQAIQDMDNSLPLVKGKNTWVRVYVTSDFADIANHPIQGVTATLEVQGIESDFTNKQMLFYDSDSEIIQVNALFDDNLIITHESSAHDGWDEVLIENFDGVPGKDVFFYDKQGGVMELWSFDPTGPFFRKIHEAPAYDGWDIIVAGNFDHRGNVDILLYDNWNFVEQSGKFQVISYNPSDGFFKTLSEEPAERDWTNIVSGDFNGDFITDILLYKQGRGFIELHQYNQNLSGFLKYYQDHKAHHGWDSIVSGDFDGEGNTDVLFYDSFPSRMELWTLTPEANTMSMLHESPAHDGWDIISSNDFDGGGIDEILFYDENNSNIEIWEFNSAGPYFQNVHRSNTQFDWDIIATGNLGAFEFNQVLQPYYGSIDLMTNDLNEQRRNATQTINFEIPALWTLQNEEDLDLQLRVNLNPEINGLRPVAESNISNNDFDAGIFTFHFTYPLTIDFHPVIFDVPSCNRPSLDDFESVLNNFTMKVIPTSNYVLRNDKAHQVSNIPEANLEGLFLLKKLGLTTIPGGGWGEPTFRLTVGMIDTLLASQNKIRNPLEVGMVCSPGDSDASSGMGLAGVAWSWPHNSTMAHEITHALGVMHPPLNHLQRSTQCPILTMENPFCIDPEWDRFSNNFAIKEVTPDWDVVCSDAETAHNFGFLPTGELFIVDDYPRSIEGLHNPSIREVGFFRDSGVDHVLLPELYSDYTAYCETLSHTNYDVELSPYGGEWISPYVHLKLFRTLTPDDLNPWDLPCSMGAGYRGMCDDGDGDGIPNHWDACIFAQENINGISDTDGCPDVTEEEMEEAPQCEPVPGLDTMPQRCKARPYKYECTDIDNDGIRNPNDQCPYDWGTWCDPVGCR